MIRPAHAVAAVILLLAITPGCTNASPDSGDVRFIEKAITFYDICKLAAGGIIGAGTVPLWNYLRRRYTRPILTPSVEKDGMIFCSPARVRDSDTVIGKWIMARIRVTNTGQRPAIKCRALLTKVERLNGSTYDPLPYHDYLPVTWSHIGSTPIELGPNVPTNIDLCRLELPANRFILSFEPMPFAFENLIDADGGYRLHLLITADDAKPTKVVVRVDCRKGAESDNVSVELLEPRPTA